MPFIAFTDEQLYDLETRFGRIHERTPAAPPRSRFAPAKTPDPEPPYQVVFRPATPGEWDNIMGQANDARQAKGAPKNLAKATVIAVSFGGEQALHAGDRKTATDKAVRRDVLALFDRLLLEYPGVPELVADDLADLNRGERVEVEKG